MSSNTFKCLLRTVVLSSSTNKSVVFLYDAARSYTPMLAIYLHTGGDRLQRGDILVTPALCGNVFRTPAVWPNVLCQAAAGCCRRLQWQKSADTHRQIDW